jgi:hypothetical protein
MHPQLAAIIDDYERAQARLHRLRDRLTDEEWTARPSPDRWSPAECVAHLNLTSRAFLPRLREAFAAAPPGAPPARLRRDPAGWIVSVVAGPLPRVGGKRIGRVRTTGSFVPLGGLGPRELVDEFDALQAEQVALVREADGRPIDRLRIASPFAGNVRYSVYSALYTLPRHQHRHLDQAEEAAAR